MNNKINVLVFVRFQRKFDEIKVVDDMVSSDVLGEESFCIAVAGHQADDQIEPMLYWCKAGLGEFTASEVLSPDDPDDFNDFLRRKLDQLSNFSEENDDDEAFFDTVYSALTDWSMNYYSAGKLHCEAGTDCIAIADLPEVKTPELVSYILHRNLMNGSVDAVAGVGYFDFIEMMEDSGGEWSIKKESIGVAFLE